MHRVSLTLSSVGFIFVMLWAYTGHASSHPHYAKHPQDEKQLEGLLQRAGLQQLELQPADLSLPLKDLKDQSYSLSKHRGQVLMLSRWATWCGACRSEMPYKHKLRGLINDPRFKIIGISDESSELVSNYHKQNTSPFDHSLLDPQNMMQKFFPGGAIPVTILIDGWGWVIGLKRGAAKWDSPQVQALIRFLISKAPAKEQLREKAPAPHVNFSGSRTVKDNTPFTVNFALTWTGESDKYARISFRLPKNKHIRILGVSSSSIGADQQGNHRLYTLNLHVDKAGKYNLNPILMNYWLKDYDQHFQKQLGQMALHVLPKTSSLVPNKRPPLWALGVLLGAGLLFVLFIFLAKRQRLAQHPTPPSEEERRQQAALQLDSQLTALIDTWTNNEPPLRILDALQTLYTTLEKEEDAELGGLIERLRYGGNAPDHETIKQQVQRLQRTLTPHDPTLASRLNDLL